jgi:hypothetical protein
MTEAPDGLHFRFKASLHSLVFKSMVGQDLEGNLSAKSRMPGQIHPAHSAPAQWTNDFVFAKLARDIRQGVRRSIHIAGTGERSQRFGDGNLAVLFRVVRNSAVRIAQRCDQ